MTEQETEVMVKDKVFKKYHELTEEQKWFYDMGYDSGRESFNAGQFIIGVGMGMGALCIVMLVLDYIKIINL
jgi:hypothetical protein